LVSWFVASKLVKANALPTARAGFVIFLAREEFLG
jgi:hypothetical protein